MADLKFLTFEEAEGMFAFYMRRAVFFRLGVAADNVPVIQLLSPEAIVSNSDGSITWTVREIGLGLHSFLEITTGEEFRRTVTVPLCLVNPHVRECLKPLLASTVSPDDGRFNSKPAEFYVVNCDGRGFKAETRLENLTLQYVMLQLFPDSFASRFRMGLCPFCGGA